MRIQKSKNRNMNRREIREDHVKQLERIFRGEGLYVYRNRTSGDLSLPKPTTSGRKVIGPGQEWQGDNYYMSMVPQEATIVRTIMTPQQERENKMNQKLILDQPDQVKAGGKVEHVAVDPTEMLTETPDNEPKKDILLTEDPLEGVQILRG